jgi:LysR family transcriptional regulator, hydrogen peroxide-inducible genes activator
MTISQIQYAIALLKHKSYHKAADELNISQPALSMQIQKFEQELGFQLFDRSQRNLSITPRGRTFLDRAIMLNTDFLQLKKLSESLIEEPQGELRIGIIPTLAPYLLPFIMDDLSEKYDQLQIHITEALTDEILEGIKYGRLDAGVISTPLTSITEFEFIPLFYEGFKLYVSPLHRLFEFDEIPIVDIDIKDIWLLKEGNCFRNQVINMCDIPIKNSITSFLHFESASIESLCRIVEKKDVMTIIPELSTLHVSAEKEHYIKEIKNTKHVREISLVHLPNAVYKSDIDIFGQLITSNIPKKMLSLGDAVALPITIKN